MLDFESYKLQDDIDQVKMPSIPKIPKEKDPELFRIYANQLDEYKIKKEKWNQYQKKN